MVVYLFPARINELEYPTGAYCKVYSIRPELKIAAFPADCIKNVTALVDCVIIKLHIYLGRPVEYFLIHLANILPTAFDPAQGIVHRNLIGMKPIPGHRFQVAIVEGVIELHQRLIWCG